MIKAVIIDIDDTFSLTEAASFGIENSILERMGKPPMSRKVHLNTWERPLSEALAIRAPGIDVEAFRTAYLPLIEEYTRSGELEVISEANYTALDKLAEFGMSLMVLTSRDHNRIRHMLDPSHPLSHKVEAIYYQDNLTYRKPDPRIFDGLLADTGLLPEQCVYVGDAIRDGQAAKGAGLYFIANLESGLRQKQDFVGIPVDLFIRAFPDVVRAVRSLNSSSVTQR